MNTVDYATPNALHANARHSMRPAAARLRYKHLAFGVGLALGSLLVCGVAAAAGVADTASPTGGHVTGGVGTITQQGASTVINQQSQLLSLDWQTFNVGKDASVQFNQPGFSAVALNRILDQNPSQIFGKINSNGQIFLINTHGIIFGASAQLNVGGLVASTLDLTPDDFLKQHFALDARGGSAGIVNHGTIAAASGGSVTLIGGQVVNDGLIVADYGHINLDGADKAVLNFDGDGLVNVEITGALQQRFDARQAAVSNTGTLQAQSGTVVLEASAAKGLFDNLVNNSGVIDAHGISTAGGVVRLVGSGGNVIDSGSIDASGTTGGSVQLLSDQNVGVMGGSIDASGANGGGSIRVGGGWQGGEGLQTASATYIAPDATLNADATQRGNGGSVVVWGNDVANFYGSISARGGALGGDGGRVETSSHYGLNAQGSVDASAAHGLAGLWLLDPYNVTIGPDTTADSGISGVPSGPDFTATGNDSTIKASEVGNALQTGTTVSVFTGSSGTQNGDITVSAPITASGSGASLYLKAAGSIFLDSTITATSGSNKPLNVYLWANYAGGATDTTYSSNASCASSTQCQIAMGDTANAGITSKSGDVDLETTGAFNIGNSTTATTSTINTGSGNLTVNAAGGTTINSKGTLTLAGAAGVALGSVIDNGTLDVSGLTAGIGMDSLGGASSTASVVLGGNTLTIDNALAAIGASNTFAGDISGGTGGKVALTGGMQALTGSSTYKGGTTINGGATLQVASDASLGNTAGAVSIDGATLQASGAFSSARTINIAGISTIDTNGNDLALSGQITSGDASQGTLDKVGAGTLTLSANNSLYKYTQVDGGTLALSGAGAALGGKFLTVASGATFDISQVAGATVYTLGGAGTVALGSQKLTLGAGGGPWTFSGSIVDGGIGGGAGGSVDFSSTGQTGTLAGINTYTGTTTIENGTLALSGAGSIADSSGVDVQSGATFDISGTTAGASIQALTGNGSVALGSQTLTFTGGSTDWTFGGVAADGGIVTSTGGGLKMDEAGVTGTLTGNNNYTGGTTLTAGTLAVSADANLGSGGGVVLDGGTLESTASFTLNHAVSLTGNGGTLLIDSGKNLTVANAITGTGPLVQAGASGTLTLDGDVTTTGATQAYSGTVALGNNVNLTGSTVTLHAVTGGTNNLTVTGNAVLDGVLSNINDLKVTGATDLGVIGVNTNGTQEYDGALTLNGGNTTLTGTAVTVNAVTGNGNDLKIAGNAVLDGALASVGNLWVTGTTALGVTSVTTGGTQQYDQALTLGGDTTLTGTTVTLNAVTGGTHALTIDGAAALDGALAGVTNLHVTGTTALGTSSVTTSGTQQYDNTLALNGGDATLSGSAVTLNGVTGNNSSLAVAGDATLNGTLSGLDLFSVSGTTALGLATITSGGTQTYTGAVTLDNDATLISTGGSVDFVSTVDSATTTPQSLDVSATSGDIKFGGAVGFTQPVNNLTTTSSTLTVASTLNVAGDLSITTTGGPIVQSGAWSVNGASNFSAGNNAITLGNAGNDFTGPVSLSNTGSNAVYLDNGGHALTLGTLSLGNGALTLTDYGATPLLLTQSITTDSGAVSFGGAVTIGGSNVGIDTTSGGSTPNGANISFGGNVEGQSAGADNLTLNAGNIGNVSFGGNVSDTVALGNLDVTAKAISGIPAILTVGGTLSINTIDALATGASWSGANVSLQSDGDVTLAGDVTAASGNVDLRSINGSVIQNTGVITAATLTGQSQGATVLGGANSVAALGNFTASGFSLVNAVTLDVTGTVDGGAAGTSIATTAGDLTIDGAVGTAGGNTALDAAGNLPINGTVGNAGGTTTLTSAGAINEGTMGKVVASSLSGSSVGATTLGGANLVTALGNFTAAGFTFSNAQGLTVAGDVEAGSGTASVTTTSGDLSVNGPVVGSAINLASAGDLTLVDAINSGSGTTTLTANGQISETGGGKITAGTLIGSSTGATTLGGANMVAALGNFSANGFSLTNATALDVTGAVDSGSGAAAIDNGGNALTIDGSVTSNGNALTLTSGDLAVNGSVDAGAGTATLNSSGAISEGAAGVIKAATLTGGSTGATTLDGANVVTALGNFTANGLDFSNAQALDVTGNVDGGAAGTRIATTAGNLVVDGTVGTTSGNATLDSAANLIVNGTVGNATGTTQLTSGGTLTEGAAGNVVAATLTGSSVGDTTLDGNNHVATLGTFDAANLTLVDDQALIVAGPISTAGGAGNISFTTTAGNALDVGLVLAGGSITLDSGSDLTIANDIQGTAVDLSANGNLAINAAVDSGAGATTLHATGAISESGAGAITAGTLTGGSTGATTLDGANLVGTLGGFTANGFSLANAQTLDVTGTVDGGAAGTSISTTAGDLTIDGAVGTAGGNTALDAAGNLAINGAVGNSAGGVQLKSGGAISEGTAGAIAAASLTGASTGDTTLDGNNQVASLGAFEAKDFSFTNAGALSVDGLVLADGGVLGGRSGNLTLTTTNGGALTVAAGGTTRGADITLDAVSDLAIDGTVDASGTLTLLSAGAISEAAGGMVTAGVLTGQSTGSTVLDQANQIGELDGFSADGLTITSAIGAFAVAGTVDGGAGGTTLTSSAGNMVITGTVGDTGGTTTLVAAGSIDASGGAVNGATLTGSAGGSANFTGANDVATLGDFTADGFNLTNAHALDVAGTVTGGVAGTTLTTTVGDLTLDGTLGDIGGTTTLNSAGAIIEGATGVLNAATLTGSSAGATTLTGTHNTVTGLGTFTADGFSLATNSGLTIAAGGTVDGGGSTTLTTNGSGNNIEIDGTIKGNTTTLVAGGAINEGSAGVIEAGTLTGSSVGDTTLGGPNRVDSIGQFNAQDFALTDAQALSVDGPLTTTGSTGNINLTTTGGTANTLTVNQAVQGGAVTLASAGDLTVANSVTGTQVALSSNGDLAINAAVNGGAGTVTLTQAGTGAITGGVNGSITAGTLTGSANGTTTLGSASQFMANHVDILGGFVSHAGFSFTNDGTLTLASVNGSAFTVDAGQAPVFMGVRNGDLLQSGTNWLYDGTGTWSSTGHIGLATAPIYVLGVGAQTVPSIGLPPAYFFAVDANGNFLPLPDSNAVNLPQAALNGRSQGINGHSDHYIDISVVTAQYRPYGVVQPGILLPPGQRECPPDQVDAAQCPQGN